MCMVRTVGDFLLKGDLQEGRQSLKSALSQVCIRVIFSNVLTQCWANDVTQNCLVFPWYITNQLEDCVSRWDLGVLKHYWKHQA